ncbi:MAG: Fpg/Nei family DNA glycosylase [Opitutales bacterium]|nr:Fpg/Nei family DNA glycosylase [Opitutales bacterium]
MPELAEVEYYRRQWLPALGETVSRTHIRPSARVFRNTAPDRIPAAVEGHDFREALAHGKQMLFRFGDDAWLLIRLGMAGKLERGDPAMVPAKHDHLVLFTAKHALAFNDYRMFGSTTLVESAKLPDFWRNLPPMPHEPGFTRDHVGTFLRRRAKAPVKAVLLIQERFPGIGNWMADEVLWRARIHPAYPAGRILGRKLSDLHRSLREVTEDALRVIAPDWSDPPDDWLFNHRWRDGGTCPATGKPLRRETIGGRTTCYSPAHQKWPPGLRRASMDGGT